jgi:hypothetical protein
MRIVEKHAVVLDPQDRGARGFSSFGFSGVSQEPLDPHGLTTARMTPETDTDA